MEIIDWIVLSGYLALTFLVVVYARSAKSFKEFAVGGRQIPGAILFATLSATIIGPGYSMGLANKASQDGYIWFTIYDQELYRLDTKTEEIKKYEFSSAQAINGQKVTWQLYKDSYGVIWMGTFFTIIRFCNWRSKIVYE